MSSNNKDGPGKRLSQNQWLAVRTAFIIEGWSYEKCAQHFKLNVNTIYCRSKKEQWKAERDRRIATAKGQVDQELQKRLELETERKLEAGEAVVDALKTITAAFVEAIDQKDWKAVGQIRDAIEGGRSLAEMHDKVLRTKRLDLGIKDGEPTVTDREDTKVELVTQRLEPVKVKVNEKGRAIDKHAG